MPQLPARNPRTLGECGELDPDDAGVHLAGCGEAGEAAIGAGDHVLASDRAREAGDALGDQFGVLDDVRGMGDDPGNEGLALGQFDALPHLPFMLVARVAGLERIGAGVDPALPRSECRGYGERRSGRARPGEVRQE